MALVDIEVDIEALLGSWPVLAYACVCIFLAAIVRGYSGSAESTWRVGVFLPALLAGVWLGARAFKYADPAQFHRPRYRRTALKARL